MMTKHHLGEMNTEGKSPDGWNISSEGSVGKSKNRTKRKSAQLARGSTRRSVEGSVESWFRPDLDASDRIASLDDQQPATLYYLDLVRKIPQVTEIHVEPLERGRVKHWTVLAERDYDAMEAIYEIEENTLDHFPLAELRFRVTVDSEDGPSISPRASQIYPTR